MSFEFRDAVRGDEHILVGLAGGTGSGKTYTALRLATGLSGGEPFAVIDTEAGRAKHYADLFAFKHGDLGPPFTPDRYLEAIVAAEEAGFGVVVVDSASHEHAGDGGLLDWHDAELDRIAGDDWKKRQANTFTAWIKPKQSHKRFVSRLLQLRCHLILCFRAEEKIEIVREGGETKVVPKRSLAGLDGWVPIAEKNLPYEMTVSFLFTADAPGIPKPIKLQEQHKPFFDLKKVVDEESGKKLAAWAAGGKEAPKPKAEPKAEPKPKEDPAAALAPLVSELTEIVAKLGAGPSTERIAEKLGETGAKKWLEEQIRRGQAALAAKESTAAGTGTPDGGSGAEASETEAAPAPEPAAVEAAAPLPDEPGDEPEESPREGLMDPVDVAGLVLVPRGTHTEKSIAAMRENAKWLKWAIEHPESWEGEETFYEALKFFVRERLPEVWEKVEL